MKFELLSDAMKNTPEGRLIQARYDKLGVVKVGRQAPDFTLPTLDGSTVTLYNVKAPVKILDFWASWCAPCRKENWLLSEFQWMLVRGIGKKQLKLMG